MSHSMSNLVSISTFTRGQLARHSIDQYTVSLHYYLLGSDTAMPGGPLARLCHTF